MATSKTITLSQQYINNATSPTSVTYTTESEVVDAKLVAGARRTNPGVFTAGTPSESYGGANINGESVA